MADILKFFRNEAVGFIVWLDDLVLSHVISDAGDVPATKPARHSHRVALGLRFLS